jgi:hypothetical protein
VGYADSPNVMREASRERLRVDVRNSGAMPGTIKPIGSRFVSDTQVEMVAAMERPLASPWHRHALGGRAHWTYRRKRALKVHSGRRPAVMPRIALARGQQAAWDSQEG